MEQHLSRLGVYGYGNVEPIILAALVTEDPLLLIDKAGTGKTFLLNSLSEALRLEHRHYNASLISFDDLVGFPYPTPDFAGVKYLETPGAVWGAESVLVDEISRCKPEHQNRLFSLIQERCIQGMKLKKLRYRWAAMNPCTLEQGVADSYEGSVPLDQALADRFAFVVEVPDWEHLDERTQGLIADPRGDGLLSDDGGETGRLVKGWQKTYRDLIKNVPKSTLNYACLAGTMLCESNLRISPRRIRQLVKNLLAVTAVSGNSASSETFLLALTWSIPHRAWGIVPNPEIIKAAHKIAWDTSQQDCNAQWLNKFHIERELAGKVRKLFEDNPGHDTCTIAVTQFLAQAPMENAAAFAFAVYPLSLQGKVPVGQEGINEMGKIAAKIVNVQGEMKWEERTKEKDTTHPEYGRVSQVLATLTGKRRERATQLFYYLLVNNITVDDPVKYEREFDKCITVLRTITQTA